MKYRLVVLASIVLMVLLFACEQNKNSVAPEVDPEAPRDIVYTHDDSVEAIEMGYWLTGELVASPEWVERVLYDLYYLREKFADEYSIVSLRYKSPWIAGQIGCQVDSTTAELISSHQYPYWDQLPEALRPDSIKSYPRPELKKKRVTIAFSHKYNPQRMAELYEQLPGFVSCHPSGRTTIAIPIAASDLYPRLCDDGAISWLFFMPVLNIPDLHFFKTINNMPVYIGCWDGPTSDAPEPEWWQEAELNAFTYNNWHLDYIDNE